MTWLKISRILSYFVSELHRDIWFEGKLSLMFLSKKILTGKFREITEYSIK